MVEIHTQYCEECLQPHWLEHSLICANCLEKEEE
jgi:hypothetical protein